MAMAACCVKILYFSLRKNSLKFKLLCVFFSRHHHPLESIAKIATVLKLVAFDGEPNFGYNLATTQH